MGTNYYYVVTDNVCTQCHRVDKDRLHFGKSSTGWVFTLHVIPERNLKSLEDWVEYVLKTIGHGHFEDENGNRISPEKMMNTITKRWYNGLVHRHVVGEGCVGQDKYTDWVEGDFR